VRRVPHGPERTHRAVSDTVHCVLGQPPRPAVPLGDHAVTTRAVAGAEQQAGGRCRVTAQDPSLPRRWLVRSQACHAEPDRNRSRRHRPPRPTRPTSPRLPRRPQWPDAQRTARFPSMHGPRPHAPAPQLRQHRHRPADHPAHRPVPGARYCRTPGTVKHPATQTPGQPLVGSPTAPQPGHEGLSLSRVRGSPRPTVHHKPVTQLRVRRVSLAMSPAQPPHAAPAVTGHVAPPTPAAPRRSVALRHVAE